MRGIPDALARTTAFADLPGPWIETANKLHALTDILVIATCATIAGAEGWEDIAEYGGSRPRGDAGRAEGRRACGAGVPGAAGEGSEEPERGAVLPE